MSGGPALTGISFVGPVGGIQAVVLNFNESLNPNTAQDVQAYVFGKVPPQSTDNTSLGDFFPFLGKPKHTLVVNGKIQFQSATYNDADHSVTLVPYSPFKAIKFLRILRVKGTGQHAVKDVAGNPLNGGADALIKWTKVQGKQFRYTDIDGDIVTLTLHGKGTLYAFYRRVGAPYPFIFIDSPNAKTTVVGTVRKVRTGDGSAELAELEGAEAVHNNLLDNPQFIIRTLQP